jgi:hypothetical protein
MTDKPESPSRATTSAPTSSPESDRAKSLAAGQTAGVDRDETGFYEAYAGFARTLRTWLVAYGIGAPVLFLTQSSAAEALKTAGAARAVAVIFLTGVSIQVLGALLYKTTMWQLYMGELSALDRVGRWQTFCEMISTAYWLEFAIDASTIALFGWATWRVVFALT